MTQSQTPVKASRSRFFKSPFMPKKLLDLVFPIFFVSAKIITYVDNNHLTMADEIVRF
jgi:hypothetical protein